MKIKITFLLVTVITLISFASCSVRIGGHGRVGHPPSAHHAQGHGDDHD